MTRLSYGTASIAVLLLAVAALAKSPGATLAAFTLCVLRDLFVDLGLHHVQRAVPH